MKVDENGKISGWDAIFDEIEEEDRIKVKQQMDQGEEDGNFPGEEGFDENVVVG